MDALQGTSHLAPGVFFRSPILSHPEPFDSDFVIAQDQLSRRIHPRSAPDCRVPALSLSKENAG